jgi:hypothetical protein
MAREVLNKNHIRRACKVKHISGKPVTASIWQYERQQHKRFYEDYWDLILCNLIHIYQHSSKTSVKHLPDDSSLYSHHCENHRCHKWFDILCVHFLNQSIEFFCNLIQWHLIHITSMGNFECGSKKIWECKNEKRTSADYDIGLPFQLYLQVFLNVSQIFPKVNLFALYNLHPCVMKI